MTPRTSPKFIASLGTRDSDSEKKLLGRPLYPLGRPLYPLGRPLYPLGRPLYPLGRPLYPLGRPLYPLGSYSYPETFSIKTCAPDLDFRTGSAGVPPALVRSEERRVGKVWRL